MAENKQTGMIIVAVVLTGIIGYYAYTKMKGGMSSAVGGGGSGSSSTTTGSSVQTTQTTGSSGQTTQTVTTNSNPPNNVVSNPYSAAYSALNGIKAPMGVYGTASSGLIVVGQGALTNGISPQNTALIPSMNNPQATYQAAHQVFLQLNRLNGAV